MKEKIAMDGKFWTRVLFEWADNHKLPNLEWCSTDDDNHEGFWHGFPRSEQTLLSMTELNLLWHDLHELPEELGYLKQLTNLSINKCRKGLEIKPETRTQHTLRSIPQWVFRLTNLKVLDLGGNAIAEIPSEIGKLTNLQILFLSQNKIHEIPDSIRQCSKLTFLGLSYNQLRKIPVGLFECNNLEVLYITANKIDHIPNGLSKLTSLMVLELARNRLQAFPEEIILLENLNVLTLLGNNFMELPAASLRLKNLENFDMLNCEYSAKRNGGNISRH